MTEDARWIASDETPRNKIDFITNDYDRKKIALGYIFIVFPLCIILFSILVWIGSLCLNLYNQL